MRAAIYTRVSTEEQTEGWSLDAQKDECVSLLQRRGWQYIEPDYLEPGRSAKTDLRPVFQRMMRDAELRRFDVIVVHKLDRFSRSLADVVKNVARLKEAKVGLVSVAEPWLDTTTPQGEFMLYLFALLAQWDNQNRARESAKGKAARARAGYWNGSLSFGYVSIKQLKNQIWKLGEQFESGLLPQFLYSEQVEQLERYLDQWSDCTDADAVPHPKNAEGVRLAFSLYAHGNISDHGIAIALNEAGYRTTGNWGERLFEGDTVRPMLKNPFYLGKVQYQGEWIEGRHPALIPESLFEQCQAIRAQRRGRTVRAKSTKRVYPLSGLVVCTRCQKPMRGQPNWQDRRYYRDPRRSNHTCTQLQIQAEKAEQAVIQYLSAIRLPQDWRERILSQGLTSEERNALEAKRQRLENQLERSKKLYLMGDMGEAEYLQARTDLTAKLAATRPVEDPDLESAALMLENIGQLLEQATPNELEDIFHALLTTVYLDSGRRGPVVAIEPKPFLKVLMDVSQLPERPDPDDPTSGSDGGGHFSYFQDSFERSQMVAGPKSDTIGFDVGIEVEMMAESNREPVASDPVQKSFFSSLPLLL